MIDAGTSTESDSLQLNTGGLIISIFSLFYGHIQYCISIEFITNYFLGIAVNVYNKCCYSL